MHAYHQEHETLVLRCFVYFAFYAVSGQEVEIPR